MLRLQAEKEEAARAAAQIEMLRLQAKEVEARAAAAAQIEMLRLQAEKEEAVRVAAAAQIEMLRLQAEEEEAARAAAQIEMLRLQAKEEEARVAAAAEFEMQRLQADEEEAVRVAAAAQIEMQRLQDEDRVRKEEESRGLKELELAAMKSAHEHEIDRLEKEVEASRIASVFSESARSMQEDIARISNVKAAQKLHTEREKFAREAEAIRYKIHK